MAVIDFSGHYEGEIPKVENIMLTFPEKDAIVEQKELSVMQSSSNWGGVHGYLPNNQFHTLLICKGAIIDFDNLAALIVNLKSNTKLTDFKIECNDAKNNHYLIPNSLIRVDSHPVRG